MRRRLLKLSSRVTWTAIALMGTGVGCQTLLGIGDYGESGSTGGTGGMAAVTSSSSGGVGGVGGAGAAGGGLSTGGSGGEPVCSGASPWGWGTPTSANGYRGHTAAMAVSGRRLIVAGFNEGAMTVEATNGNLHPVDVLTTGVAAERDLCTGEHTANDLVLLLPIGAQIRKIVPASKGGYFVVAHSSTGTADARPPAGYACDATEVIPANQHGATNKVFVLYVDPCNPNNPDAPWQYSLDAGYIVNPELVENAVGSAVHVALGTGFDQQSAVHRFITLDASNGIEIASGVLEFAVGGMVATADSLFVAASGPGAPKPPGCTMNSAQGLIYGVPLVDVATPGQATATHCFGLDGDVRFHDLAAYGDRLAVSGGFVAELDTDSAPSTPARSLGNALGPPRTFFAEYTITSSSLTWRNAGVFPGVTAAPGTDAPRTGTSIATNADGTYWVTTCDVDGTSNACKCGNTPTQTVVNVTDPLSTNWQSQILSPHGIGSEPPSVIVAPNRGLPVVAINTVGAGFGVPPLSGLTANDSTYVFVPTFETSPACP